MYLISFQNGRPLISFVSNLLVTKTSGLVKRFIDVKFAVNAIVRSTTTHLYSMSLLVRINDVKLYSLPIFSRLNFTVYWNFALYGFELIMT